MPLHQPLLIQFKKSTKGVTLTVKRADGTLTWTRLYPGMEVHDLAHYAVEKNLELENAFFGILARGYDIDGFEAPKDERLEELRPANLPPESLQTEHLVNMLLTEIQYGEALPDFLDQFNTIISQRGLPPMPRLTASALGAIRCQLTELCTCWRAKKNDEVLELRLE